MNKMKQKRIAHFFNMFSYYSDTFARLRSTNLKDVGETAVTLICSILNYQVAALLIEHDTNEFELLAGKGIDQSKLTAWTSRQIFLTHVWNNIDTGTIFRAGTMEKILAESAGQLGLGEVCMVIPLKSALGCEKKGRIGLAFASQPGGNYEPDIDIMAMEIITGIVGGAIVNSMVMKRLEQNNKALSSEISRRKKSEEKLQKYRSHLEEMVRESTDDLSAANEKLQGEINERRRAERFHKESEILYRTLFEDARDAIIIVDLENDLILKANRQAEVLLSRPRKKIIGLHQSQIYPPDMADNYEKIFKEQMGVRAAQPFGAIVFTSDDRSIPVEITSSIIELSDGKKVMQAFFRDITERKRAEKKLVQAYQTAQSISEKSPFGIFTVNSEGDIDYANQAVLVIADSTYEQFMQVNIFESQSFQKIGLSDKIQKGLQGAFFFMDSIEYTPFSGKKPSIVCFTGVPIKMADENKVYLFVQDITELKQAEEELKKAINVKSDFISMVSHELRTPLTTIKEGICIVLDGLAGDLTHQQKFLLEAAQRSLDRLTRLINNVLDFQKIESGKILWDIRENDINEIVRETYTSMLSVVNEKGLHLTVKCGEDLPGIQLDRDKGSVKNRMSI